MFPLYQRDDKEFNLHIWWKEEDLSKDYTEGWALEEPPSCIGVERRELDPR